MTGQRVGVIYQDPQILVIDKPPLLLSSKLDDYQPSVEDTLRRDFNITLERGGLVHRLDKDTSGVLVAAKTFDVFSNLEEQFRGREVKKQYLALVHGAITEPGLVDVPIARNPSIHDKFVTGGEGKLAATRYEPIDNFQFSILNFQRVFSQLKKAEFNKLGKMKYNQFTLLKCFPLTGRTHQIRVHLKYINHPIVADKAYVGRKIYKLDEIWCPRQFLHAKKIGFYHPETKEWVEFESPLPEDLENVLVKLKGV